MPDSMPDDDPRGMHPCLYCGQPSRLPLHPECLAQRDADRARKSPAYPTLHESEAHAGLTKREYMATKLLAGLLANPKPDKALYEDGLIIAAVTYADMLLEALE